jgi:hypothetical protein
MHCRGLTGLAAWASCHRRGGSRIHPPTAFGGLGHASSAAQRARHACRDAACQHAAQARRGGDADAARISARLHAAAGGARGGPGRAGGVVAAAARAPGHLQQLVVLQRRVAGVAASRDSGQHGRACRHVDARRERLSRKHHLRRRAPQARLSARGPEAPLGRRPRNAEQACAVSRCGQASCPDTGAALANPEQLCRTAPRRYHNCLVDKEHQCAADANWTKLPRPGALRVGQQVGGGRAGGRLEQAALEQALHQRLPG